jgi:hypothetical protein
VEAQDHLDHVQGFSRYTSHGFVVNDKDGDGIAAVDLLGYLSLCEIVIEGAQLRVPAEEPGDVEGGGGRGEEEEES